MVEKSRATNMAPGEILHATEMHEKTKTLSRELGEAKEKLETQTTELQAERQLSIQVRNHNI